MATLAESLPNDNFTLPNDPAMDPTGHTNSTSTDSMVSIRLSEPASDAHSFMDGPTLTQTDLVEPFPATPVRPSSEEIMHGFAWTVSEDNSENVLDQTEPIEEIPSSIMDEDRGSIDSSKAYRLTTVSHSRSVSHSSASDDVVDWVELEKTEESEQRDEVTDESTAFLLARLEQENQALATDPRFMKVRARKMSRPPSIHVLRRLVQEPSMNTQRFSHLPNPPPMTELEFWAALVKDYPQTAQRLPTLTANKIKGGVPSPLRGVVWMSMVGARDRLLADEFDKLSQESSPYEGLISKDIGRSFPGVEMFKDAEGDGQQMLGRVLKAFSLYDNEIGYCQGLGFLVGPLLMQMNDRDAFCVLVRLMEMYDLRSCFLPSLAGLHLRIFQFQRLLTQHLPTLAAHLATLQVEAAYLSQWFLSFFAVTCPLEMLFRIYDVIFAEGASETIMRVALSLMRRNEATIMASTEFEDVMQLLLSRSLWDTYELNADDLVNDFTEMTGVVTRESLQNLEVAFKEAQLGNSPAWFAFLPDATAAASSFLGRMWNAVPAKNSGLSPGPSLLTRPTSFLRRTASKQSIAVSINSTDMSSEGTNSLTVAPSESTQTSRGSAGDVFSLDSKAGSITIPVPVSTVISQTDKDLHSQIEDLLMALSDMQQQLSMVDTQLQKEREERGEDHRIFEELVNRLPSDNTQEAAVNRRQTLQYPLAPQTTNLTPGIDDVVEKANERLEGYRNLRRSVMVETKQRLRDSLVRSKDQLQIEQGRSAELSRQLDEQGQETATVREQLRDVQARLQDELRDKQRLEKQMQDGRFSSRASSAWSESDRPTLWRSDTGDSRASVTSLFSNSPLSPTLNGSAKGGLRELRLGRPESMTAAGLPKRGASLATQTILSTPDHAPATEDQMLIELVAAKTSEAEARQELEEVKGKLDAMRRMLGVPSPTMELAPPGGSSWFGHRPTHSETTVTGTSANTKAKTPPKISGSGTSSQTSTNSSNRSTPVASPPAVSVAGIGAAIWGWGKRSASTTTAVAPTVAPMAMEK